MARTIIGGDEIDRGTALLVTLIAGGDGGLSPRPPQVAGVSPGSEPVATGRPDRDQSLNEPG